MYSQEVLIPEGVQVEISGKELKFSGPKGHIVKKIKTVENIKIEKVENKIKIFSESERRKVKGVVGSAAAHIKNAVEGVTKGFTYRLRIVYSHFPVTVKIEGDKILIQNFLGEKIPRVAKILGKTQVKVEGQDVIVTGIDLEDVSQTAGNIEQATRIVGYDKKVFQDGIWIASKGE